MIVASILFLLSAIGSAWPEFGLGLPGSGDHTYMYLFVAYRILGGIGVGLASMVSPMYIAEVAPADRRGNLVSWNQFAIIFGMLVVYFVNYTIALQGDASWLHTVGWRWMFASEIIPAVFFFTLLMFVPETPRYLVMRGKTEKALTILDRLMGKDEAAKELVDIKESFKEKAPSMRPYFRFMGAWLVLFLLAYGALELAGNTSALEIALIGSFFVSLAFPIRSYGVLIIMVGILLSGFQQFVGINVVLYYAPEIFKTMGAATDAALLQQIVVGAVNLSFTVLAIFTVDKFGRPSVDDYRCVGDGCFHDYPGNNILYTLCRHRLVGLYAGVYCRFRYVMGTCLLGIAGGNLPELDPFDGDEYCRCRTVDCQLPRIVDFPDA